MNNQSAIFIQFVYDLSFLPAQNLMLPSVHSDFKILCELLLTFIPCGRYLANHLGVDYSIAANNPNLILSHLRNHWRMKWLPSHGYRLMFSNMTTTGLLCSQGDLLEPCVIDRIPLLFRCHSLDDKTQNQPKLIVKKVEI